SDFNGDPLTYYAQVAGQTSVALNYRLDQQLGLTSNGYYYTNFLGRGEKWLQGNDAQYFLLSDGELRHWTNAVTSFAPAGLVANVDPHVYDDPTLLWQATNLLELSGNVLTVHRPAAFAGSFAVQVAVSDGQAVTSGVFTVNVPDAPPVLVGPGN